MSTEMSTKEEVIMWGKPIAALWGMLFAVSLSACTQLMHFVTLNGTFGDMAALPRLAP
jgi:hypothetical protein